MSVDRALLNSPTSYPLALPGGKGRDQAGRAVVAGTAFPGGGRPLRRWATRVKSRRNTSRTVFPRAVVILCGRPFQIRRRLLFATVEAPRRAFRDQGFRQIENSVKRCVGHQIRKSRHWRDYGQQPWRRSTQHSSSACERKDRRFVAGPTAVRCYSTVMATRKGAGSFMAEMKSMLWISSSGSGFDQEDLNSRMRRP